MTDKKDGSKLVFAVVQEILSWRSIADTPAAWRAAFLGGVVANVVAHIPDDYWHEMLTDVAPCGEPNCDCHILFGKTMALLDEIRNDHRKHSPRNN